MNKENTEKLYKKYPEFFKYKDDMKQSLMCFGFACNDGWFKLIDKLCHDIKKWFITEYDGQDYNGKIYRHVIPSYFYIQQVKEKYGSLRFYISPAPEKVHDMIRVAELKSYYICEECGKEGKEFYRDKLPWIRTLCDECLNKHVLKIFKHIRKAKEDYISDWQKKNGAPYKLG